MMKQLMALTLAVSVSGAFAQNKPKMPAIDVYKVDTAASKIEWVGKKVTGEHRGFIMVKEGSLSVKNEEITAGTIVVDMGSMTVTDITDAETAGKFLGHMKSPDFFNVEKYPTAKLVILKSSPAKNGLEVKGKMTILDKTNDVTFTVTDVKKTADSFIGKAMVTVDRTKFGLKYGSGQFFKGLGDKMINDEFTLNIDLTAKK